MGGNCFEELGLERRLTWSEEDLRERYDVRCRQSHPDAGGSAHDFQGLREAYAHLRSPGRRLRLWLELGGEEVEPGGPMEEAVAALFAELSPVFQRTQEVAQRFAGSQTVLGRSLAEREAMELMVELEGAREKTSRRISELTARFTEFERRGAADCAAEAAVVARSLLFLEKWEAQLRESWAKLAG